MTNDNQHDQTPTPRDYDDPSFSELVPIKSKQIKIIKSPFFWFVLITGALTLYLWSNLFDFRQSKGIDSLITFGLLITAYLLIIVLSAIYIYSRTDKPIWAFVFPLVVVYVLLMPLPFSLFAAIFRDLLPAGIKRGEELIPHFIYMFSGAGLMEELIKSVPGIIGAALVLKFSHLRETLPNGLYDLLAVRGPLDGLLFGVFAGAMFIFLETGYDYFPRELAKAGGFEGALQGLMLVLPRVTGGMVGHMCYAGIIGYFIGLYVIRPKTWHYVLYGWIGASLLHAMWNTQGFIPWLAPLSTFVGGVFFVACLLKARQMEQATGKVLDSYGSIVVDPASAPAKQHVPPSPNANRVQPVTPPAASAEVKPIFLRMGAIRISVVPGQNLDFSSLGAAGIDIGKLGAEATRHPTRKDVIGLKNTGDQVWSVTLRDGSVTKLEKGRNLRLAPGVKIEFEDMVIFDVEEG